MTLGALTRKREVRRGMVMPKRLTFVLMGSALTLLSAPRPAHGIPPPPMQWGMVAFAPDGKTIANGRGTAVELWDARTGRLLQTLPAHSVRVTAVAFSADGRWLASGGMDQM